MTPEETATLQGIGNDVVRGFVAITNETFLLTIYGVLIIKAGFVLLDKDHRGIKTYLLTMTALLTMFVIAIVLWTLDLANFITEAKVTLVESSDQSIDSKLDNALAFVFRLAAAQDALYAYMSLLGDAIIIHRVWILKAYYRPWVVLIPCAFLFGSSRNVIPAHRKTVATLMLTYCVGRIGSDIVLGNFENPAFCRNVQLVTYVMPCATTAIATSLIGLATWKYRLSIMTTSVSTGGRTSRSGRSQGERVLVLLVESGLLYFLFFGIYPTILVVLAHSKHAVIDGATSLNSSRRGRMNMGTDQTSTNWPTFQIGTKREEEFELDTVLQGRTGEEGRKHPAFEAAL
ncbi:hypothetical protein B0H17DRAFT_1142837 [Mycena rosella]|uniref:Uncharacterized protein n=1 Tax=Mycena rosella TaxID=1033263 RepID=A0AAD7CX08_MYCRO|nr:hypothetical protein B0H17DRAFT_1142837 [Mycena rosella]